MTGSQAGQKPANSLRLTLWILLIVYIFNFLDRQIVNILAEPIARDLNLKDWQIGVMTGIAFAAFYTFLGIPIARFADKPTTNRVGLISISLVVWSAMTALCGMAQNFVQLLLARIGVGVGEAGCTPAAHSLIADLAPPEKRASAISFYSLGIPIGGLLGMVMGGLVADAYGWRMAFLIAGLPGILMALVVWFVLRDPRMSATLETRQAAPTMATKDALAVIFKSRAFIYIAIAGAAAAFLGYGKGTWTTIFFQRTHDLTPGEVGFWFGIGGGIAGAIGTLRRLAGRPLRQDRSPPRADRAGRWHGRRHSDRDFRLLGRSVVDRPVADPAPDGAQQPLHRPDLFLRAGAGSAAGPGHGGSRAAVCPEPDRAGAGATVLRHPV